MHDRTRKIIILCQIPKYKKIIVFIANFRFEHLLTSIIIIFLANSLFSIATLKNNFLHCEDPDNQRPPVFYIILNALVGLCSFWKKKYRLKKELRPAVWPLWCTSDLNIIHDYLYFIIPGRWADPKRTKEGQFSIEVFLRGCPPFLSMHGFNIFTTIGIESTYLLAYLSYICALCTIVYVKSPLKARGHQFRMINEYRQ